MIRHSLASLLTLALAASACAPRHRALTLHAPAPGAVERHDEELPVQDVWRRLARQLPPAAVVRVQLADGTRLKGTVLVVEDDAVVVKPRTRLPEPPRRIPYATIESLDLETGRGIGAVKAAAIGVGTGAATFVALIFLTLAMVSD